MSEEREDNFARALQRTMQPMRRVKYNPVDPHSFEEKFVTPFRKQGFSLGFIFAFGGAAAFAAAISILNFFGHGLISEKPLVADVRLPVKRTGLLFGSREIQTSAVIPQRDLVKTGESPISFNLAKFARVTALNSTLKVVESSSLDTKLEVFSGKGIFRFEKSDLNRTLLVGGRHTLRITGTIVYVDAEMNTVAIFEGKILFDEKSTIHAGEEYSWASGQKRPINTATRTAARVLDPDLSPEKKTEESIETKLFRKYGNVFAVTLRSGQKILASQVVDGGNLRLFSLGGPLYVAENEIATLQKLR